MELPDVVPILGPDDFCRGTMHRGERHCLIGWSMTVVDDDSDDLSYVIRDAIRDVIRDSLPPQDKHLLRGVELAQWNDTHSLQEIADVWNDTMRRLGYIEDAGYGEW